MDYHYVSDIGARFPELLADSILSQTLYSTGNAKVVLFGFAPGQSLSEHTASVPAIIHVLAGSGSIELGGNQHDLGPGSWIYIPSRLEHAVRADGEMRMLLILLQSGEGSDR